MGCPAPSSASSSLDRVMSSLGTGPVGGKGLLGGLSSRSTSSWKPATIGFPAWVSLSLQGGQGSQKSRGGPRAPTLASRPGPVQLLCPTWTRLRGTSCQGSLGAALWGGGRHMCEKSRSGGGSERDGVLGRVRGGASGGHKLAPPLHTRPAPGKKCTAALLPQAPSSRPGLCSQAAAAQGQARGTPAES